MIYGVLNVRVHTDDSEVFVTGKYLPHIVIRQFEIETLKQKLALVICMKRMLVVVRTDTLEMKIRFEIILKGPTVVCMKRIIMEIRLIIMMRILTFPRL